MGLLTSLRGASKPVLSGCTPKEAEKAAALHNLTLAGHSCAASAVMHGAPPVRVLPGDRAAARGAWQQRGLVAALARCLTVVPSRVIGPCIESSSWVPVSTVHICTPQRLRHL